MNFMVEQDLTPIHRSTGSVPRVQHSNGNSIYWLLEVFLIVFLKIIDLPSPTGCWGRVAVVLLFCSS
jgi:hypothetical protein